LLNEPQNTVTIANEHLQYVHALTVFSPNIDLLQGQYNVTCRQLPNRTKNQL